MRIVIDFQGVSETWRDTPGERRQMDLLRDIAKSGKGHDIIVALNASDKQLVRDVRELLFDVLPGSALRIWNAPDPFASEGSSNSERRGRAELIREAFLSSLAPDLVLVNGFRTGCADRSVASISKLVSLPTAVIVYAAEEDTSPDPKTGLLERFRNTLHAVVRDPKTLWARSPKSEQAHKDKACQGFPNEKRACLEKADHVFLIGNNPNPESIPGENDADLKVTTFNLADTSLEHVAQGLLDKSEELGHQDTRSDADAVSHRKKLAYISPLPPAMSGIAEYSAQLVPELAQHYEITLITDQEHIDLPDLDPSIAIRGVDWFRRNSRLFDHVLYHFGNSPMHGYMFALLRSIPGVVVLHDFFLLDGRARYNPNHLRDVVLQGHGLQQFADASRGGSGRPDPSRLPGNLDVLQNATGIIVHSDQPFQLAREWYGPEAAKAWYKVPLLRPSADYAPSDKVAARKKLGLSEDDLVICSFGHIVPSKLGLSILEALQNPPLAEDPKCILVFVGDAQEKYEHELRHTASELEAARFKITGWVSADTYREYLLAADIAVQLRSNSRGETSASVLDCLNFGLPTIVNAHGSMREIDPECICQISDPVDQTELVEALKTLASDRARRESIGARGRGMIRAQHDPRVCAELYQTAIESAESSNRKAVARLPGRLAATDPGRQETASLAQSLAQSFPPHPRRPSLFLDVSVVSDNDIHTGIQRVVRSVVQALLSRPDIPYRVVPVRFTNDGEYLAAYAYAQRLMGISLGGVQDEIIDVYRDDLFVVIDLDFRYNALRRQVFEAFQNRGARIWHVVYDLLPVKLPQYFPSGAPANFVDWLSLVGSFDGAICISKAVADDLKSWLEEHSRENGTLPAIGWFHLGADIENSRPTTGLLPDADQKLTQLGQKPTFLMVGTIEPRKGHAQTLDAFERLWSEGIEANLAIVGKEGWDVDPLVRRLREHSERGARLFWFDNISDEYLERIYQASTCLIAASEGEGFGLPLIEAAQHKLPILARDLAVFQEVAGDHAVYFTGLEAADLADAIREWLTTWQNDQTVVSDRMPWLTWEESAAQLLEVITRK